MFCLGSSFSLHFKNHRSAFCHRTQVGISFLDVTCQCCDLLSTMLQMGSGVDSSTAAISSPPADLQSASSQPPFPNTPQVRSQTGLGLWHMHVAYSSSPSAKFEFGKLGCLLTAFALPPSCALNQARWPYYCWCWIKFLQEYFIYYLVCAFLLCMCFAFLFHYLNSDWLLGAAYWSYSGFACV